MTSRGFVPSHIQLIKPNQISYAAPKRLDDWAP